MRRTGDPLYDVSDYLKRLEDYKPEDGNGWWRSMLISAGLMFAEGLRRGNIAEALGAAIFGAAYGGFHKGFDEELIKSHKSRPRSSSAPS